MTDQEMQLEYEREIFRRTAEGRSLNLIRERWPFPEPLPAHKRPTAEEPRDGS